MSSVKITAFSRNNRVLYKDRGTLLLASIMLLIPATAFALVGDAPQTLLFVAVGLIGSFGKRRPLERNLRTFIYAGLFAMMATVLSDLLFPVDPQRFFLMPAQLYCPAVLYLGVAATYFDQRDTNLTAIIAFSLIALMLAGNTLTAFTEYDRLPFIAPVMKNFHAVFGAAVALEMLTMLLLLPRVERRKATKAGGSRRQRLLRYSVVGLALIAGGFSVVGMRHAALYYERLMQRTFARILRNRMYRRSRWIIFSRDVDLWRTVHLRNEDQNRVMLRVTASHPPGYMRSRAYRDYSFSTWVHDRETEALTADFPGGRYAYTIFTRGQHNPVSEQGGDADTEVFDIYPASHFRSKTLFVPGNAVRFEMIAEELTGNQDGVLWPKDWDQNAGYTVYVPKHMQDRAYQRPGSKTLQPTDYLRISDLLRPDMEALSSDIFADLPETAGVAETVDYLLAYFRANFEYALEFDLIPEVDPVVRFLSDTKRGHCELFASAAVLLLRTRGIPARYVTGVVCREQHPSRSHYIARLRDAHAWAEVYDEAAEAWVRVEATPPSGIPQPRPRTGAWTAFRERVAVAWQEFYSLLKRGHYAEAILAIVAGTARAVWRLIADPVRGILIAVLLGFVGYRFWRRYREREATAFSARELRELRKSLTMIERRLGKLGIKRSPCETLRELGYRAGKSADLQNADLVWELLHEYENLRYRQSVPSAQTVAGFAAKVRRQLSMVKRAG